MRPRPPVASAFLLALGLGLASSATAQFYNDHDLKPHSYFTRKPQDPMSLLMEKVDAGKVRIAEENGKPLVERLLRELDLDKDTQVLVFSKTSLQRRAVSYENPRAIYFNESVYLGWMPNGRIEIASFDPEIGPLFYFQRKLDDNTSRLFVRTRSCLGCHAGSATNYLPGALGRSVYPDRTGRSMRDSENEHHRSGHEIPMKHRWGGWFVSGKYGKLRHMGNTIAERVNGTVTLDRDSHVNLARLDQFFPTENYPAPGSDIAALLVFDHQITMHHRLVEAAYRARQSIFDSKLDPNETDVSKLRKGDPATEFQEGVDMVVDYLLFREEVELESKVACDPGFRRAFTANKRADKKGNSLKDLRLDGRIFENRCSYMIYSPSFDKLVPMLRKAVYERLHKILTAPEPVKGFEYLEDAERKRIYQILRETKSDLPPVWTS